MTDPRELRRFMFRDPAEAVERLQEESCHGCAFLVEHTIYDSKVEVCRKGRKPGKRCKDFEGEPV